MAFMGIYDDSDIYGPVQRAQEYRQQQNALAAQRVQQEEAAALRNALAANIDPQTGQTNWQNALAAVPVQLRPQVQALMGKSQAEAAELASTQATTAKTTADADKLWLSNARDQYASGVFDQGSHTAWRNQVIAQKPFLASRIPEVFDPKRTRQQMLTTADNAMADIDFQTTSQGVEGIDVRPTSPTFGKTLIQRGAPPKSPGVSVNVGAENAFGKGIAENAAKNLQSSFERAKSASRSTSNLERLTPLVNDPKFISGTLGDVRLAVSKALGVDVSQTETYLSQMASETAEAITAFGSGSSLTDADREYAANFAGGNIKLSTDSIKRILFLRAQANRAEIKAYNDELRNVAISSPQSGVDRFYKQLPVPPPPSTNPKGWRLFYDKKNDAYAYVSPDGKNYEETQ